MSNRSTAERMWVLDAPTAIVDKSYIEAGAIGDWLTPFPAFLVEHSEGLVLFDTGLSSAAAGDPAAVYGASATSSHMEFSREQRLDRQLSDIGFDPADVEHVVISHLHFDHTGGMGLFPDAQFYLGAGEMRYALDPDAHLCNLYRAEELTAAQNYRLRETDCDLDLFGDSSITLLLLPGHSPGSLALQVELPSRTVLLSGDVVHTQAAFASGSAFPLDQDGVAAVHSIERLRSIQEQSGAQLWVGHDPDDWHRFGAGRYE